MNEEARKAIEEAMESVRDAMMEESARIGVLRSLLEQLYANLFIDNRQAFEQLIAGMVNQTTRSVRPADNMSAEDIQELQARMLTHLQRFGRDVSKRIEQGRV